MRILITGHKGYIGGVLVPMLEERGHDVTGCDTDFFADCLYIDEKIEPVNLAIDVRDLRQDDLAGFDAIVHLAGLSNDPLGSFKPELTFEINQAAAEQLAVNARSAGVGRFIFASSCSNYGASDGSLLAEDAPFNPQTPYGASKCVAETSICALESDQFAPCNLRAGTVYGLAPRIRFDLVVNNLVAYAVANGSVYLKSDGRAWRPLVHVSDVARAYVAALEAPAQAVSGESFNVGQTSENYQIIEVAKMIQRVVPGSVLEVADRAGTDSRDYRIDCDKIARQLPGFQPQWNIQSGITELVSSLLQHPVRQSEFEGARFNRLVHLRQQIEQGVIGDDLRFIRR